MNINQFRKLAEEIYNKVYHTNNNYIFLCCDFFNLAKNHPAYLEKKNQIIESNFFKYFCYLVIELLKIFYDIITNINFSDTNCKKKINNQILFISHLTKTNSGLENYYGRLNIFSKSLAYFINHTSKKKIKKKNTFINTNFNLKVAKELKIIELQILSFNRVFFYLLLKKKLSFGISFRFAFELLTIPVKKNLRIYFQLDILNNAYNLKKIISTCEGYAHEKIIFYFAQKKKITSIAYQNIPLIKNQILINKNFKDCHPDFILTSGSKYKRILQKYYKKTNIKIYNIGGSNFISKKFNQLKIKNCLVVPEGFENETIDMFNLINNFTKNYNNDLKFIFRIHPNLHMQKFFKKLHYNKKKIILSNKSFYRDLRKSDIIIFRGSSAVAKAVSFGLIPIYYKNKENLNVSPIYNLNHFYHQINNCGDLNRVIKNIYKISLKKNLENRIVIQERVKQIYDKFDKKKFINILKK